jgi:hypothetical protein
MSAFSSAFSSAFGASPSATAANTIPAFPSAAQGRVLVSGTAADTIIGPISAAFQSGAAAAIVGFDAARKGAEQVLSNSNLTVARTVLTGNQYEPVVANRAIQGKCYFEFRVDQWTPGSDTMAVGLAPQSFGGTNDWLGHATDTLGYLAGGTVAGALMFNGANRQNVQPYGQPAVIAFAVDTVNRLLWVRAGAGNWNASGTANPATGAGGYSFAAIGATLYPCVQLNAVAASKVTASFGHGGFASAIPAGFQALEAFYALTFTGSAADTFGAFRSSAIVTTQAPPGTGWLSVFSPAFSTAFTGTLAPAADTGRAAQTIQGPRSLGVATARTPASGHGTNTMQGFASAGRGAYSLIGQSRAADVMRNFTSRANAQTSGGALAPGGGARLMTIGMAASINAAVLQPIFFIEMETRGGFVNAWTGYGSIDWDGKTWLGVGHLVGLSALNEVNQVVASGVTLTLSGVDPADIEIALAQLGRYRTCKIWFAVLGDDGLVIDDPIQVRNDRTDSVKITNDGISATIAVGVETRLIAMRSARERRYTDEDQKSDHPGDDGFKYVNSLQNETITWGRG